MKNSKRLSRAICVSLFAIIICRPLISSQVMAVDGGAAACSRRSFRAVMNFPAGLNDPFNLIVGDYNGDDLPDLAVFGSNKSAVLIGDGAGRFGSAGAITTPIHLTQAVSGDFNGDAIPDLAGINFQGGNTQGGLMLGDGTGNFRESASITTDQPRHSVAGDFNGDGKLDLVVASHAAKSVTVYPGDGKGQFSQAIITNVERNPSYVVEGDFNGDGKTDLAVANEASDSVTIIVNDGTGRFNALNPFSVDFGPYEMVAGDFNRDGRPDLAVMKNRPRQLFVFLNSGAGQFTRFGGFDATDFSRVIAADFNSDNALDLAVAHYNAFGGPGVTRGEVAILLGDGAGSFQQITRIGVGRAEWSSWLRDRREALNLYRAAVPIEFYHRVPASQMRCPRLHGRLFGLAQPYQYLLQSYDHGLLQNRTLRIRRHESRAASFACDHICCKSGSCILDQLFQTSGQRFQHCFSSS